MSGLLPRTVFDAVHGHSVSTASQTFAVVALALCLVLLLISDIALIGSVDAGRRRVLAILIVPLLVVVLLTALARLALLIS